MSTLTGLGVEARRTREVDAEQYGFAALQTFFRLGEPILELLGPAEPSGDGPVTSGLVAMKRAPFSISRMALVMASNE